MAKQTPQPPSDCWVDLFEDPHLRRHLRRIHGPGVYPNLRGAGAGFGRSLGGMRAGPMAYALIFQHASPDEVLGWLLPGETIGDLTEISSAADSLRIDDHPPPPDQPAYPSYAAHSRRRRSSSRSSKSPGKKTAPRKRGDARKQ